MYKGGKFGVPERSFVKFALCLIASGAVCITVVFFLYKDMDLRVLVSEFPLLLMLCVGLSLAVTLFNALTSAMLTVLLIGEYAALSVFASRISGEWELRFLDRVIFQVSFAQTHLRFQAALCTAVVAFIICRAIVRAMSRRVNREPEIVQVASNADMVSRLPVQSNADVILSQEEMEFILARNEPMAAKK
jgi:hypothetical protein